MEYTPTQVKNFLIDSLGYSDDDVEEMDYADMIFTINDSGNLLNFQNFCK